MAVALLLRRLGASGGLAAGGALAARCRDVSTCTTLLHVQPAPSDDAEQPAPRPRWQRELGAIRTDWT